MILREFLYVDTDKVKSLLAQMDGSVVEELKETSKKEGKGGIGVKGLVTREGVWSKEESASKSAADAIFPLLEEELYSQGYLVDVSDELLGVSVDDFDDFMNEYPPGTIIRVTGAVRLFDAQYITKVLAGISAVVNGIVTFDPDLLPENEPKRGGGSPQRRKPPSASKAASATPSREQLEDSIPDYPNIPALGGITAEHLRAIVQVARGMFNPGLHLQLNTGADERIALTARLQEGRRFLDSDAEILFARYGTEAQEWTVVGTIGTFGRAVNPKQNASFVDAQTGKISRVETLKTINDIMRELGSLGMADFPRYPGFSVVPFAVYRSIGQIRKYEGTVATGIV